MAFMVSHPNVLALNLPSCAILAVESRLCDSNWTTVLSNTYNKLIEMHPNIFIGCFGDCDVIRQVMEALLNIPNDRSIGEIALFVQNTVNKILENSGAGDMNSTAARFVLMGRGCGDNRNYFFKISKGENTWMNFAKREVGNVICGGSERVNRFLRENDLDFENVTEDEAVKYGFKCLREAVRNVCVAGGRIQVVAMKPGGGGSVVHSWVQIDPSRGGNEYFYQEPRIIRSHGVGDLEKVTSDGKTISA